MSSPRGYPLTFKGAKNLSGRVAEAHEHRVCEESVALRLFMLDMVAEIPPY